jgi:hemoglobin-like flavoprotein
MNKRTEKIIKQIIPLYEYERKQIISILIASMLTDYSNKEAKKIYDNIIKELS